MNAVYIDPRKASYEIDKRYLIHSIVVNVLGAGAFYEYARRKEESDMNFTDGIHICLRNDITIRNII
jgi:hypothetical protein